MLRFEGDKDFPHPLETVWSKLTDASFLAACVPDVETVHETTSDRAVLTLRPGFSFVRGTLDVSMNVIERKAPSEAKVVLTSKGIGSSSTVEAGLHFSSLGEKATRVHWIAEVKELGGLLKLVPGGLIRGAAQKVIGDAWNAAEAKLG